MIRRSPTRIELKLDDLNDFEYIQKLEKKKNPSGGGVLTSTDVQKMARQERVGLGFRPIRASSNVGSNQVSFANAAAQTPGGGASTSDVLPATPSNMDSSGLDLSNNSVEDERLSIFANDDSSQANRTNSSRMDLDESL